MIALNRNLRDRRKLEQYWKAAGPTFEGLGAKRLAIYTPLILLEKLAPLDGAVVIEFPDVETAKRWYESPAYQAAKHYRNGAADVELFIIDGGMVRPEDRMPHRA
jgi:uncharacterized protein (DUF1330 family)